MKRLITLAIGALLAVSANQVTAQNVEQKSAPQAAISSKTVVVVGAVGKAGSYPFVEGESVMELLARAGGADPKVALQDIYVLRSGVKIPLVLAQPQEKISSLTLREGDTLVVPEKLRYVAVFGAVKRPDRYEMPATPSLSVRAAIVMAGGLITPRYVVDIVVLRQALTGKTEESEHFYLPRDIEELDASAPLQTDDVIYVAPPPKPFRRPGKFHLLNAS